jgi:hypothetical protein
MYLSSNGSNQPSCDNTKSSLRLLCQLFFCYVPCYTMLQVIVALSAEATAYSHDPKKAMPDPPTLPVGASAALVSLVQVSCHDETAHMTL